jgi:hypothetical protein
MLNVAPVTTESSLNIMQSFSVADARVLPLLNANFYGVILEHRGQNVVHVLAEVIEDVLPTS